MLKLIRFIAVSIGELTFISYQRGEDWLNKFSWIENLQVQDKKAKYFIDVYKPEAVAKLGEKLGYDEEETRAWIESEHAAGRKW
jgi:hypothetical protein